MIDPETFKTMMALIAERTPNVPDDKTLAIYYKFLGPRLTNEEFKESAMAIFAEAEFFPPPIRFLEIRSTREWPVIMNLLLEFTPPHVPDGWAAKWQALSDETRGAVVQLGGPLAFKDELDRGVMRARSAFIKTYEEVARDAAVDAQILEAPPEPERIEAGLPLGWEGVEAVE